MPIQKSIDVPFSCHEQGCLIIRDGHCGSEMVVCIAGKKQLADFS